MVEIDKALQSEAHSILCVAITFDRNWSISPQETKFTKEANANYALAIVSRIISMHYRIELSEVIKGIKGAKLKSKPNFNRIGTGELLIRETVKLIVSQAIAAGHPIRKFVLLVDEARRAEDKFGEGDGHEPLRAALLNNYIIDKLDVRLVIASLNISSAGVTRTSRGIETIRTPALLPPAAVLDEWMMPRVNTHAKANNVEAFNASSSMKLQLMSLIAVMCRLPRALEILIEAFATVYVKHMSMSGKNVNPPPFALDSNTVEELLQVTIEQMRSRYPGMSDHVVEPRYAKALLFHDQIPVDDYVMARIADSQFTNAIDLIYSGSEIYPETTAMCFHLMPADDPARSYAYASALKQTTRDLLAYIATMHSTGVEDAGRPLEIVTRGLMNARLGVMMDLHNRRIPRDQSMMELSSLLLAHTYDVSADDDTSTRLDTPIVFSRGKLEACRSLEIPVSYPNQQGDKESRKCLPAYFLFFLLCSFIHSFMHSLIYSFICSIIYLTPFLFLFSYSIFDYSEHIAEISRCHQ